MNLTAAHIDYKRKIGTLKGKPVIEVATTGGLHLIVVAKGDGVETLACGPHSAISRHLAKKKAPDMVITDVRKGDWVDPSCFAHLLPQWEATTDRIRALEAKK